MKKHELRALEKINFILYIFQTKSFSAENPYKHTYTKNFLNFSSFHLNSIHITHAKKRHMMLK